MSKIYYQPYKQDDDTTIFFTQTLKALIALRDAQTIINHLLEKETPSSESWKEAKRMQLKLRHSIKDSKEIADKVFHLFE